jgi:hypothetical protein
MIVAVKDYNEEVEFPDGMSDDAIRDVLRRKFPPLQSLKSSAARLLPPNQQEYPNVPQPYASEAEVEQYPEVKQSIGEAARSGLSDTAARVKSMGMRGLSLLSKAGEMIPGAPSNNELFQIQGQPDAAIPPTSEIASKEADRILEVNAESPRDPRRSREWVRGAVSSMAETIPAAIALGPTAAVGTSVLSTMNQATADANKVGLTDKDKAIYIATQGIMEGVPAIVMNKLGVGGMETIGQQMKQAVGEGLKQGIRRFGLNMGAENLEEQITSLGQTIADKIYTNPNLTWEDYGNIVFDTFGQTTLAMGAAEGVRAVGTKMLGQPIASPQPEQPPVPVVEQSPDIGTPENPYPQGTPIQVETPQAEQPFTAKDLLDEFLAQKEAELSTPKPTVVPVNQPIPTPQAAIGVPEVRRMPVETPVAETPIATPTAPEIVEPRPTSEAVLPVEQPQETPYGEVQRHNTPKAAISFALDHRRQVEQALSENKPVPPEVLAEYPDLQAKYGEQNNASTVRENQRVVPEQPTSTEQGKETSTPERVSEVNGRDVSGNDVQRAQEAGTETGRSTFGQEEIDQHIAEKTSDIAAKQKEFRDPDEYQQQRAGQGIYETKPKEEPINRTPEQELEDLYVEQQRDMTPGRWTKEKDAKARDNFRKKKYSAEESLANPEQTKQSMRWTSELAAKATAQLERMVGRRVAGGIKVVVGEPHEHPKEPNRTVYGSYDPKTNTIFITPVKGTTIVHEAIHAMLETHRVLKEQGAPGIFTDRQEAALDRKLGNKGLFDKNEETVAEYAEKIADMVRKADSSKESGTLNSAINKFRLFFRRTFGIGWKRVVQKAVEGRLAKQIEERSAGMQFQGTGETRYSTRQDREEAKKGLQNEIKARKEGHAYGRQEIPVERGAIVGWIKENYPNDAKNINRIMERLIKVRGTTKEETIRKHLERQTTKVWEKFEAAKEKSRQQNMAREGRARTEGYRFARAQVKTQQEELERWAQKNLPKEDRSEWYKAFNTIGRVTRKTANEEAQYTAAWDKIREIKERAGQRKQASVFNGVIKRLSTRRKSAQYGLSTENRDIFASVKDKNATVEHASEMLDKAKSVYGNDGILEAIIDNAKEALIGFSKETQLRKLSSESLKSINTVMRAILKQQRMEHEQLQTERKQTVTQLRKEADKTIVENANEVRRKQIEPTDIEDRGNANWVTRQLRELKDHSTITHMIFDDTVIAKILDENIWRGLERVMTHVYNTHDRVMGELAKIVPKEQLSEYSPYVGRRTREKLPKHEISMSDGTTLKLTKGELLAFYLHWGDLQTRELLLNPNFKGIAFQDAYSEIRKYTAEDYQKIVESAKSAGVDKVAEVLQKELNDYENPNSLPNRLNKAYEKWYGTPLFDRRAPGDNYWMRVAGNTDPFATIMDMKVFTQGLLPSAVKQRQAHQHGIIITDPFRAFAKHVAAVETFSNMFPEMNLAMKILSDNSVQARMRQVYKSGEQITNQIRNGIFSATGLVDTRSRSEMDKFVQKLINIAPHLFLSFKVNIALYQPISLLKAAGYIPMRYLAGNVNIPRAIKEMKEHPMLRARILSKHFGMGAGKTGMDLRQFYGTETVGALEKANKVTEFGLEMFHSMDIATISQFYLGKKRQARANGIKDVKAWALEETAKWVRETQAAFLPLDISETQRQFNANPTMKLMFGMFMSEPLKNYSLFTRNLDNWRHGRISTTSMAKHAAVQIAMTGLMTAIQQAMFGKNDKEAADIAEQALVRFAFNQLGMFPLVADAAKAFYTSIFQTPIRKSLGLKAKYANQGMNPSMIASGIDMISRAVNTTAKAIKGDEVTANKLFEAVGSLIGITGNIAGLRLPVGVFGQIADTLFPQQPSKSTSSPRISGGWNSK